jgi:hypothetical protein
VQGKENLESIGYNCILKTIIRRLGFDSLEGPFETGYDFKGVYKGKRVIIEAEYNS